MRFEIADNRPSKRTPDSTVPQSLAGTEGLFVAPGSYVPLTEARPVEEVGERIAQNGLLARAAAASLQRRHLVDRRLVTPTAWLEAGRGDYACQTTDDAKHQQAQNRAMALDLSTRVDLRGQADFDEIKKAGPLYGGTSCSELHTGVHKDDPTSPRIDGRAWNIFRRARRARTAPSTLRVPRGSAHGYPTFSTSDEDMLAHVSLGVELHSAASEGRGKALLAEVEALCPSGVGYFVLANTRTQHMAKAQKVHAWGTDGRLYHVGDSTGQFPRTRLVRMNGAFVNEACRPNVQQAADEYKEGPLAHCFNHGRRDLTLALLREVWRNARRRWGGRAVIKSSDLSNMDDTVSRTHLLDAFDALGYDAGTKWVSTWLIDQPLLGGALRAGDEGFLFSRNLGVLSGQVATSQLDTSIRFAAGLHCLIAAGAFDSYDAMETALLRREAVTLVQGDDWIYIGPDFDDDQFVAASANLGFKEKMELYPIFLKTWFDIEAGRFSGMAIRAAIRTQTRERRAAGPLMEAFATGLRFDVASGDPDLRRYYDLARRTVAYLEDFPDHRGLLQLPLKYPGQFEREVRTPQGVKGLRDALQVLQEADAVELTLRRLAQALPMLRDEEFRERFDGYMATDKTRPGDWRSYLKDFRIKRDSSAYEKALAAAEEEFESGRTNDGRTD